MEAKSVEDRLGEVTNTSEFRDIAVATLRGIYKDHIPKESNEIQEIGEDAINECAFNCLKWARELDSRPDSEDTLRIKSKFKTPQCEVAKYLFTSIVNYSIAKVKGWGVDAGKKRHSYRARIVNKSKGEDFDGDESQEDWLSKFHEDIAGNYKNYGEFNAIDPLKFLKDKNLSKSEIELIFMKLDGRSFEDIAKHYGNANTSDKYRKQFNKVIERANLPNLKSFC